MNCCQGFFGYCWVYARAMCCCMQRRSDLRRAKRRAIAPDMCSSVVDQAPHSLHGIGGRKDVLVRECLDYRGETRSMLLNTIATGATLRQSAEQQCRVTPGARTTSLEKRSGPANCRRTTGRHHFCDVVTRAVCLPFSAHSQCPQSEDS